MREGKEQLSLAGREKRPKKLHKCQIFWKSEKLRGKTKSLLQTLYMARKLLFNLVSAVLTVGMRNDIAEFE